MDTEKAQPSRDELYAAYQEGMNLTTYLRAFARFERHIPAMAVARMTNGKPDWDDSATNMVQAMFDIGVTLEELGDVLAKELSVMTYWSARGLSWGEESWSSHEFALRLIELDLEHDYYSARYYDVPHDAIMQIASEGLPDRNDHSRTDYFLVRHYGATVEEATILSKNGHRFMDGTMVRAVKAGIPIADLLDLFDRIASRSIIHHPLDDYVNIRQPIEKARFPITHKQAIEVVELEYWPHGYREARRKVGHKRALLLMSEPRNR